MGALKGGCYLGIIGFGERLVLFSRLLGQEEVVKGGLERYPC